MNLKFYFFLIFVFANVALNSQDLHLGKGKITDSIFLPDSKDTFTLYLPENFSTNREWPVIFAFDPGGRGKEAVLSMAEAAEEYHYVVVASNAIKNGPYQPNLKKAAELMNHIIKALPVDAQRIYLAGFSGGSRLASAIALLSHDIKGVIACGAGLNNNFDFFPNKKTFAYIGIAGNEDFNYLEVKNTVAFLQKSKYDAEFIPFNGEHTWPPNLQLKKAFRLFTLKAYNKGYGITTDENIANLYREDYEYNEGLITQNNLLWAYDDLKKIIENYRFYIDPDSLKGQLKLFSKNNFYKLQKKRQEEILNFETTYRNDYLIFLKEDIETANTKQIGFWDNEVENIQKFVKGKGIEGEKMEKRLRTFVTLVAKEIAAPYLENEDKHIDNLLYANEVQVIMSPRNYEPYFYILKYATKKSEYPMALFYLEEMLKNGFKDSEKLNQFEGISLLRISPEYNELLEKYGLKAKF
ncbi:alpha/beta hydrolase [Abyssalbus ytuae]|uniref:Alpha/beta hydrolase n=1 Tax=Abyssalbus ytuae TaxID=2926907 RepID=A0A9E6ZJL3_9FLAO|nr:alpha/beta hydrolase [Abyssalbus ytuae]UOB16772.1 alpha/beta hydrolase [Abyssalbus ytuae]